MIAKETEGQVCSAEEVDSRKERQELIPRHKHTQAFLSRNPSFQPVFGSRAADPWRCPGPYKTWQCAVGYIDRASSPLVVNVTRMPAHLSSCPILNIPTDRRTTTSWPFLPGTRVHWRVLRFTRLQLRHHAAPRRICCRSGCAREITSKTSVQVCFIKTSSFARFPTLGRCQFNWLKRTIVRPQQRGSLLGQYIMVPESPVALWAQRRRADQ